jgi:FkbH-like protein
MQAAELTRRADEARELRDFSTAIDLYLRLARSTEEPDAEVCIKLARCYEDVGNDEEAYVWLTRVADAEDSFRAWKAASSLMARVVRRCPRLGRRSVKVALTGTYTTDQFAMMLEFVALCQGIELSLHQGLYAQYGQDLVDSASELYAFDPDYVVIAVHEGAAQLPAFSESPDRDVAAEVTRWNSLWQAVERRSRARVIQHNFALRPEVPMGHLSAQLPGSRQAMLHALNTRIGEVAENRVSIVDCDRLASQLGKDRWFDDRYWYFSKQAVALDALPMLARHTIAVLAAAMGLSKKCLVLDLDNTLWGGVIGEDGLSGIRLGAGPEGEAFVDFQRYILELKRKGVILVVASKNNDSDAKEPFERHPDMQLRLDDFSMFVANWQDKVTNVRTVAKTLDIGLDAIVLVDDNPAERQLVRQLLPEVDVISLPSDPAHFRRALADYPMFETASLTAEDRSRTRQYRARAESMELAAAAGSIEDFYKSLDMKALVAPFDTLHLPRIAQLIGKTNQFNLTTRRYTDTELRAIVEDQHWVHLFLKLRDRFADHGLVAVATARAAGDILEVDNFLMSCRVIGRTVENVLLAHLCKQAQLVGCSKLRGRYVPTQRNELVRDLYARFGFRLLAEDNGSTTWEYDVASQGVIENQFIAEWTDADDPARAA